LQEFHSSRVVPVAPRCGREVGHLYPARVREQVGRDEDDPEEVDGETKGARDQAGGVAQQTAAEPPDTLGDVPFDLRGRLLRRASQEAPLVELSAYHEQVAPSGLRQGGRASARVANCARGRRTTNNAPTTMSPKTTRNVTTIANPRATFSRNMPRRSARVPRAA
jgi:hypothetical protein